MAFQKVAVNIRIWTSWIYDIITCLNSRHYHHKRSVTIKTGEEEEEEVIHGRHDETNNRHQVLFWFSCDNVKGQRARSERWQIAWHTLTSCFRLRHDWRRTVGDFGVVEQENEQPQKLCDTGRHCAKRFFHRSQFWWFWWELEHGWSKSCAAGKSSKDWLTTTKCLFVYPTRMSIISTII